MTVPSDRSLPPHDPAPLNRAARRAEKKGKRTSAQRAVMPKKDQTKRSQVLAQRRDQGRRGNK
ncbi:hypothetical protein EF847_05085 [Actinobacteria bacterium YIM 96077]|uniref:Uncharacterized protein n=1 Tax=Phytoactinopolyspora halophila TaxID=1981511 RepID=A0A329R1U6_9ACTN|nr:hypothetical protein [Phytoactinopolyspora halophila]AYY12171.1 hypothetical protein EF847_05085 [Actinobacteria bacterium YIM 96077]RAW18595.1 hypothetical protein DPM12_00430 [Phytoactinopolyspora halophila]